LPDINTTLPPWLASPKFWAADPNAGQGFKQGLQIGAQISQRNRALALEERAAELKLQADFDTKQGLVDMGQTLSEIAKSGDWTSPENKAKFWATASRHPAIMKSPAFKELTENFENADKAKAASELWQERLGSQEAVAQTKVDASLNAMQMRMDNLLKMEDIRQEHRKELEGVRSEFNLLRDSLKPTRTGQLVHDLPEADLVALRSELTTLDNLFKEGKIEGVKNPGLFQGYKETPAQVYERRKGEILKKYDAKRIGSPAAPSPQATTPAVPPDPSQRQVGTVYQTPKGPYRWNGTGWEAP